MSTEADFPPGVVRMHRDHERAWDESGRTMRILYKVPHDVIDLFEYAVGGKPETFGTGTGSITRIVPLQCPDSPLLYACYVRSTSCEGGGGSVGATTVPRKYKYYFMEVGFKFYGYDFGGDRPFLSLSVEGGGNFITLPGSAYKFPSDNLRINQDPGRFVPEVNYLLTIHMLSSFDETLYVPYLGKVNSADFLNLSSYPAGTVRFDRLVGNYESFISGFRNWSVAFALAYRPVDWNAIMRPDTGVFEVVHNSAGDPIYESADLNALVG
jgi:hypothetical protein